MTSPPQGAAPLTPTTAQLLEWGLDPAWSRRVSFSVEGGETLDWHVLDTGPGALGTIVCVHGNPSWAYLWRDVLTTLAPTWRVVAVDQTNMGYSERTSPRRLAQRVDELVAFCRHETVGPIVLAAHDWGGPVAIGASAQLDVTALVLANTAVAKPDGVRVPPLIALARRATDLVCRATPTFVEGAARMTKRQHRRALRAPYRSPERRAAVAQFVADIPLTAADPSYGALGDSSTALENFEGPVLLLWGGRDPVFNDRFLADLRRRVPGATVQRYARASHYVVLDESVGVLVGDWLALSTNDGSSTDERSESGAIDSVLDLVLEHRDDDGLLYVGPDGTLTWRELDERSTTAARVLADAGLREGGRVSVLVPPSPELLVGSLAIWKAGGVPVVADASAGPGQLRRLVRAAAPSVVVGTPRTLLAATALGVAPGAQRAGFFARRGVLDLRALRAHPMPPSSRPTPDVAAIVHTSGSTGPAKAVRYSHRALTAIRPALEALGLTSDTVFTTSFGPFLLLAPVLSMTCVRPDFPVDKPSLLSFDALHDAVALAPVTAAWLSPAAARQVVATARGRQVSLQLVMLAGAPITPALAASVQAVTGADVRAPYGMTECLPVTDGTEFDVVGSMGGYSTGRAVPGCLVRVVELEDPDVEVVDAHRWGELLVSAPWMFDAYDADWRSTEQSEHWIDGVRFHRTGDVGYLEGGRLFHLGRRAHVLWTAQGPLASVAVEGPVAASLRRDVAAVGVGPRGAEVVCIVVHDPGRLALADPDTSARVRAASPHKVAAVLSGALPLDHRHQSKVDRSSLAVTVSTFLAGR